ncbi:hypothetical protein ABEB36_014426 [Hypothenemus hampei]|uniref:Uncharacterized protein n=1 Tax=Hypothenemus hampei TaxID=57062 RepID=A0ABD1E222_HYPHA
MSNHGKAGQIYGQFIQDNLTLRLRQGHIQLAKKEIFVSTNTIQRRLQEANTKYRLTILKWLLSQKRVEKLKIKWIGRETAMKAYHGTRYEPSGLGFMESLKIPDVTAIDSKQDLRTRIMD